MPPISVLVAGDIVIDRHIYEGDRRSLRDQSNRGTRVVEETGGAGLTQRLIEVIFAADVEERRKQWEVDPNQKAPAPEAPACVLGCQLQLDAGQPVAPEWLVGCRSWSPHPKPGSKELFWRLSRAFGYGSREDGDASATGTRGHTTPLRAAADVPPKPDILVLDDAGDRFRHRDHASLWHLPQDRSNLPAWMVLKLAGPIGRGDLWDRLADCEPRQRLIVVASAQLLRQHDIRLSRGLSWERTAEHLLNELRHNPAIQPLGQARHVIVSFEGDGAVWIDASARDRRGHIVFDAAHSEGEWSSRIKGGAFGYQTCLAASVVFTLASMKTRDAEPELQSSIERGLSAMRALREEGHGVAVTGKGVFRAGQGFPAQRLASEILHPSHRFARATVPTHSANLSGWSILALLQNPATPARPLFGFARQLALRGDSVLAHAPHLRIGRLLSVDRQEMETLRSLRRIMTAYRDTNAGKKPLSLGVFGAPGSGKSFGVEQLAVGVFGVPDQKSYDGWMEFNLSQFDSPEDLIGAFHQVRDRVLQGFVPVVFWDEFDAQNYKWLQFLLAPMQDGRFQEKQITHTLGKCVFIFAGGTSATFDGFGAKEGDAAFPSFKLVKGPDFKSRLDGSLDVLGPNARDDDDVFFPVRRALVIRNLLGCGSDERLDIDAGLLTALLEAPFYRHGARSLAKVLEPFTAARRASHARLRRSQLPAPNQLALHVDSDRLHALCSRDLPFTTDDVIAGLAPAIHETYRQIARQEGWSVKYDVPFETLPPVVRRANDAAARRIPEIIALVNLRLQPGIATEEEEAAVRNQLELHLEMLAEEEHNRWVANAESEGLRFAAIRDDDAGLHDCLRPFHELRESDKEKDRNNVRHFPEFARLAGFKITFIGA